MTQESKGTLVYVRNSLDFSPIPDYLKTLGYEVICFQDPDKARTYLGEYYSTNSDKNNISVLVTEFSGVSVNLNMFLSLIEGNSHYERLPILVLTNTSGRLGHRLQPVIGGAKNLKGCMPGIALCNELTPKHVLQAPYTQEEIGQKLEEMLTPPAKS